MERRVRHHGVVEFPWELPVGPDCLGMFDHIRVGDSRIEIALPIDVSGHLVEPPDYRGRGLTEPLASSFRHRWGYRSTANLYFVSLARASFMLPRMDHIPDSMEFRRIAHEFLEWFEIVKNWCSAWTGEPSRPIGRPQNSLFHVPIDNEHMAGSPARLEGAFFGAKPLTRDQLRGAFRRGSSRIYLPTEHRLLQTANEALMEKDFRTTVIDSGTAAEVALSAGISEYLRSRRVEEDFIKQAVINANGIVGLSSLYASITIGLPISKNRIMNELAKIRNDAAHGGRIPADTDATKALQNARVIVTTVRPLPEQ